MPDQSETISQYLALPSTGKGPGVLVLHAWWGLNATFKGVCDRLAEAGFVALAPDLYHGAIARTQEEARRLKRQCKPADSRKILAVALQNLTTHPAVNRPNIGLVGFSMGGYYALGLSNQRSLAIAAVVTFYGTSGGRFDRSKAAYLGHFAEDDPFESPKGVADLEENLRSAGRSFEFYLYPASRHWFFEPDRPEYDPAASQLAWERTIAFLHAKL